MEPMSDERREELEQMDREQWAARAPYIADFFAARELRLVRNCVEYRDSGPFEVPGRDLLLLVAKLATNDGWTQDERLDELIEMAERREAQAAEAVRPAGSKGE